MLRYCYSQDTSFSLHHYDVLGVRIGIWAMFCLFLQTFLHLAMLNLFGQVIWADNVLDHLQIPHLPVPIQSIPLDLVCFGITIVGCVLLPCGYYSVLNLERKCMVPVVIWQMFEIISFFYLALLSLIHNTGMQFKPGLFIGLKLLMSLPIHVFTCIFYIHFLRFATIYSEYLKVDAEFGHHVEKEQFALRRTRQGKMLPGRYIKTKPK